MSGSPTVCFFRTDLEAVLDAHLAHNAFCRRMFARIDALIRLAASTMWERGAAAAAVTKLVVQVRPSGIAQNSAPTESVGAVSPGEAGFSGSRVGGTTTTTAEMTAVANPVAEARPPGVAKDSAPTESVCAVSPGRSWDSLGPERVGMISASRSHEVCWWRSASWIRGVQRHGWI